MIKLIVYFSVALATGATIPRDDNTVEEFIVGGRPTKIEEVPYQVALLQNGYLFCGGSIISSRYIITAGHCVRRHGIFTIRAGSTNRTAGGVLVNFKNRTVHPKYSSMSLDYDVAVVELERPLNFSKSVQPIKIVDKEPRDNEIVITSGWGSIKESNYVSPTHLYSVEVPMVNRTICEKNYKSEYEITSRMICAGIEGKDSCLGDSGGPLAYKGKLAGVVSFGIGCGQKGYPGVYVNLVNEEIRKFIKDIVKV